MSYKCIHNYFKRSPGFCLLLFSSFFVCLFVCLFCLFFCCCCFCFIYFLFVVGFFGGLGPRHVYGMALLTSQCSSTVGAAAGFISCYLS